MGWVCPSKPVTVGEQEYHYFRDVSLQPKHHHHPLGPGTQRMCIIVLQNVCMLIVVNNREKGRSRFPV